MIQLLKIGGLILLAALIIMGFTVFNKLGQENDSVQTNQVNKGSIPPIDKSAPEEIKTATFGLGCFWGSEAKFGPVPGVARTRVGYAGGTKETPTYHALGDHTEVVRIDYDPTKISYDKLLDIFWESHNPTTRPYSQQYKSVIFYHTQDQKTLAEGSRQEQEDSLGGKRIFTDIAPIHKFYLAEAYHQKYHLRRRKALINEFKVMYPKTQDLIDSTAAARVNGYLAGYGTLENLRREIAGYGLYEEGRKLLLYLVANRR